MIPCSLCSPIFLAGFPTYFEYFSVFFKSKLPPPVRVSSSITRLFIIVDPIPIKQIFNFIEPPILQPGEIKLSPISKSCPR